MNTERYQELLAIHNQAVAEHRKWREDHPDLARLEDEEKARKLREEQERIEREERERVLLKQQEIEKKRQGLMIIKRNADKIIARGNRRERQNFSLTDEDKKAWWDTLEKRFPRNYNMAIRYYNDMEDPALSQIGLSKNDFTVNEYFEIYGLPRVYTDENHRVVSKMV